MNLGQHPFLQQLYQQGYGNRNTKMKRAQKNPQLMNEVDEELMDYLQRIKNGIIQDHRTSNVNHQHFVDNVSRAFALAEQIMSLMYEKIEHLKAQHLLALQQVEKNNPILSNKLTQQLKQIDTPQISQIRHQIRKYIHPSFQSHPSPRTPQSFKVRTNQSLYELKQKQHEKRKIKRIEYSRASSYIRLKAHEILTTDETGKILLPKDILLSAYLDWSRKNNFEISQNAYPTIQMALTTQVKREFPRAYFVGKNFKGLKLKKEYYYFKKKTENFEEKEYGQQEIDRLDNLKIPDFSENNDSFSKQFY